MAILCSLYVDNISSKAGKAGKEVRSEKLKEKGGKGENGEKDETGGKNKAELGTRIAKRETRKAD